MLGQDNEEEQDADIGQVTNAGPVAETTQEMQPVGGQQTISSQEVGYSSQPVSTPTVGQPPPASDSTAPPPQVPINEKGKPKTVVLVLAIIILVVAGFAGFYLGSSGLINGNIVPAPTPIPNIVTRPSVAGPTDTPTPTPDLTLSSEIYDSDKFFFRYPDYLLDPLIKKDEQGQEISPKTYESVFKAAGQEAVAYTVLLQIIGPEPNPDAKKLKEWLGENNRLDQGPEIKMDVGSLTVGGYEAQLVSGYSMDSDVLINTKLYFALEDGVYSVGFVIDKAATDNSKYKSDFERMLATFTFK